MLIPTLTNRRRGSEVEVRGEWERGGGERYKHGEGGGKEIERWSENGRGGGRVIEREME
ncbi:hypothetical protein J6590_058849 [Homalodisca vitripennis]|nr:hypothetical protein J6590_058849 [Homalodisca vitripennis]